MNSFSQEKGIVLENKNNQKKVFIEEKKRIKIRTTNGEKYIGNYSIIDENTIKINDITVSLDSISSIQKRSLFNSIARPILFATGSLVLGLGIVGAIHGGYGYIATIALVPPGSAMTIVPAMSNKHHNNNWNYSIESVE